MAKKRTKRTTPRKKPSPPAADPLDPVFKALANADRRAILDLLRDGPRTTGELCQKIDWLDRCTVMLHLRTLEKCELVIPRREGRSRWNYLNHEPIQRAYRRWIKDYAEPAADFLVNLKRQLESCSDR